MMHKGETLDCNLLGLGTGWGVEREREVYYAVLEFERWSAGCPPLLSTREVSKLNPSGFDTVSEI